MPIFEEKVKNDRFAFLFYGDIHDDDKMYFDLFALVARKYKTGMFYHTSNKEIIEKLNPEHHRIIVYNNGSQVAQITKTEMCNGDKIVKIVETFLVKNSFEKFDERAIQEVFIKKQSAFILFRNKWDNSTQLIEDQLPYLSKFEVYK